MEEYNEGKSDTIEGIEIISDSEMIFHLKEFAPTVLWGGPFMYEFVNAKQLEGIPYDEIMESDAMRKNPLSYGPYFVTDVVPGESISWEANPYYYKGEPKVKYATTTIIPVSQEIAAARAGNFDLMFGAGSVSWPEYQELTNYSMITTYDLYMNYVGFRVGEMDNENHVVVTNPDAKMNDPQLKRAMKLALDMDSIGEVFYHGLRFSAKTFTAPMFEDMLHDPSIEPIGYDEEAAKALLEEAGYVDTDGDGFREDKEGNPLEINFAFMSGGDIAEQLAQYYIQQWGKIGLNVKLVDDRLLDQNNFYDRMENDDPAIDVYVAGFGFASDPNPSWFLGESAGFNLARYTSDALQGALDKINSQEALGDEKMQQFYYELEKVFFDELPIIPLQNRVSFIPVNKRVKVYESRPGTDFDASMIELTAKEPIAE